MTGSTHSDEKIIRTKEGYFIIRQAMPYPLAETNAHLIEAGGGWAVIDVGIDNEATRRLWETAVARAGIAFRHINAIYITHCHPDHLGAAKWLQQKSEAPVYMMRSDIEVGKKFFFHRGDFFEGYRGAITAELVEKDFPLPQHERLVENWCREVAPFYPEPELIVPLEEGDTITLRGETFGVIAAPGHTDGQMLLYSEKARHLFLADVLSPAGYLHFTEWPNTFLENPLSELFACIDRLTALGEVKTFPGHGAAFDDLGVWLAKLRRRHERILARIAESVTAPVTAGEVYTMLGEIPKDGPYADYVHLHRVLMGEMIGYLSYLVASGNFKTWLDGGKRIYCPA